MKKADLLRIDFPDKTMGKLTYGDKMELAGVTIELPNLNNHPMTSCICDGDFILKWAEMQDHPGHWHYLLQNVPNRSGCFFHRTAMLDQNKHWTPNESLGCVMLTEPDCDAFEAWGNKEDILLHIHH